MRQQIANPDRIVARIAANQHGVLSFEQLLWAGVTPSGISRRVKAGRLHRIHRGVYAVGHPNLSREGRWLAAVLACGPGAVLSHASAAQLWSLTPRSPPSSHVTVSGNAGRAKRKDIVLHRSSTLTASGVTRKKNIPVTTLARTQRDMGWTTHRTRSDLERAFLRLLRSHDLPMPESNARVGPYEVDFLWRSERLAVELDSYAYHSDRASFTADRARDRYLTARGFTPVRFSDDELDASPGAIVAALGSVLA